MAWTRRRLVTVISTVYLIIAAAIAAYAMHTIRYLSLPVPTLLGALTLVLPFISGLSLEILTRVQERQMQKAEPSDSRYYTLTVAILLIYETAVATLSGTYFGPPGTLSCGLDERWRYLFRGKHADSIQRIQNTLECCGLHSPVDMAYPFPSHDVGVDACQRRYDRSNSCFADWQAKEQLVAGFMLLVVLMVFLWKTLVVLWQTRNTSWMASYRQHGSDPEDHNSPRRMLGYRDANEEEQGLTVGEGDEHEEAVNSRGQPSRLRDESNQWGEEQ